MPSVKGGAKRKRRPKALKAKLGKMVKVEDFPEAVENLKTELENYLPERELKLFSELQDLANYIQMAKTEIALLRPDEVKEDFLPAATDELDAIIAATANATNNIMDAVEDIENVIEIIDGEPAERLTAATTAIYEACGFQDITGQRITKVVKTLKDIEEKVEALVKVFGDEIERVKSAQPKKQKKDDPISDEDLLHGPQTTDKAKSQDEIDALLASFD